MSRCRSLVVALAATITVASCGVESTGGSAPFQPSANTVPVRPPAASAVPDADVEAPTAASAGPPTTSGTTENGAPDAATPRPGSQTAQLDQPAIWPASDVVLATPEEAAAGFVSDVLGVDPVLGEFRAGDSRSGEIQVFSPGEVEGAELLERGLLGLRIIGPDDGWFVIAASSDGVSIEAPEPLDRVPAGPLAVTGRGRGFEGTLVVTAFRAGSAADVLDQVITRGGPFERLEPFSVTLDLSGGAPGDVVAVLVRGDTGLGGDPGDFASLPIVIGEPLPATR